MKLNICVEVDEPGEDEAEFDLGVAASDHEEITIRTAGGQYTAVVIDVAPAGGQRG